ncbi:hypothetical protein LY90DRAFT_514876, partial [Neocallimastix californiae]
PGRYFYAIKFYIEYFSEILRETNDLETIKLLLNKVYNATPTILLYPKKSRKTVFNTYTDSIMKLENKISETPLLNLENVNKDYILDYLKLHENLINKDIMESQGKLRTLLFDTYDIDKERKELMDVLIDIYLRMLYLVHNTNSENEELKQSKFFEKIESTETTKLVKLIEVQLIAYCKLEKAFEKREIAKAKEREKEKEKEKEANNKISKDTKKDKSSMENKDDDIQLEDKTNDIIKIDDENVKDEFTIKNENEKIIKKIKWILLSIKKKNNEESKDDIDQIMIKKENEKDINKLNNIKENTSKSLLKDKNSNDFEESGLVVKKKYKGKFSQK